MLRGGPRTSSLLGGAKPQHPRWAHPITIAIETVRNACQANMVVGLPPSEATERVVASTSTSPTNRSYRQAIPDHSPGQGPAYIRPSLTARASSTGNSATPRVPPTSGRPARAKRRPPPVRRGPASGSRTRRRARPQARRRRPRRRPVAPSRALAECFGPPRGTRREAHCRHPDRRACVALPA